MHLFDILRHFRLFPNIDNRRLKKANRIQGNGKKVDLKFVSIFQFLKKIHIRLKLFEFQEFFLNGTLVLKQTLSSKKRSMGNQRRLFLSEILHPQNFPKAPYQSIFGKHFPKNLPAAKKIWSKWGLHSNLGELK